MMSLSTSRGLKSPVLHLLEVEWLQQCGHAKCRCLLARNAERSSAPEECDQNQSDVSMVGDRLHALHVQRAVVVHSPPEKHLDSLTDKNKRSTKGQMMRRRGLARLRNQLLFRYLLFYNVTLCFGKNLSVRNHHSVGSKVALTMAFPEMCHML